MKLFLDCCALNRPFDDQRQMRVHLEAEAVLKILDAVERDEHELLASSYLLVEIRRTPDRLRQQEILLTVQSRAKIAPSSDAIVKRAESLMSLGLRSFDALHISAAETMSADWLLTTDDGILKFARRHATLLQVKIANPLDWSQQHLP